MTDERERLREDAIAALAHDRPSAGRLSDAEVQTIYAAFDKVAGLEAKTIKGRRDIVTPLYEAVIAIRVIPFDAAAYVEGHWDGLHCEANGFGGRLSECKHVGHIYKPVERAASGSSDPHSDCGEACACYFRGRENSEQRL